MTANIRLFLSGFLLVWLCVAHPQATFAQFGESFGMGFLPKKVVLQRKLPPVMNIKGKTVSVVVKGNAGNEVAELQSAIENLLTRSDSNLRVEMKNPDVILECNILNYAAPKTTTSTSYNSTTKKNESTTTLTGNIRVAVRVIELRTKILVVSRS